MVSDNEVKISEQDLATLLRAKVNTITNLELQVTTLSRIVVEKDGKIEELEGKLNDTGEDNAKSGGRKNFHTQVRVKLLPRSMPRRLAKRWQARKNINER